MLRALAVMEDEAAVAWRALPADRLPYRVDRDLLDDALGHRPAHGLTGEGACHGCEIEPPFSCVHAGDAAHPKPVAPAHGESALCQVQPRVSRLDLLLDAAFSGRDPSGESELPHDAEHALLARGGRFFAVRGRCAGSRSGPCAARRPRRRTLRAPLALSGRWTSSGRDTRGNRISRLSSARMPS